MTTSQFLYFQQNNELHHLNMSFLRHQKGLMPLFILGFGGSIFVGFYLARYAVIGINDDDDYGDDTF